MSLSSSSSFVSSFSNTTNHHQSHHHQSYHRDSPIRAITTPHPSASPLKSSSSPHHHTHHVPSPSHHQQSHNHHTLDASPLKSSPPPYPRRITIQVITIATPSHPRRITIRHHHRHTLDIITTHHHDTTTTPSTDTTPPPPKSSPPQPRRHQPFAKQLCALSKSGFRVVQYANYVKGEIGGGRGERGEVEMSSGSWRNNSFLLLLLRFHFRLIVLFLPFLRLRLLPRFLLFFVFFPF